MIQSYLWQLRLKGFAVNSSIQYCDQPENYGDMVKLCHQGVRHVGRELYDGIIAFYSHFSATALYKLKFYVCC